MIVSCAQMLDGEESAFRRGVSAAALMEEAGRGMFGAIRQFQPQPATAILYLGKGNNAGDALVVGRHLLDAGWKVHARLVAPAQDFKPLPASHWQTLRDRIPLVGGLEEINRIPGPLVLVDGIVGISVNPSPLRGEYAKAVAEMNALRQHRHAFTVALDLPSGLNPHLGEPGGQCVRADLTVTVGQVKDVLVEDTATSHVGRLAVAPLRELETIQGDSSVEILTSRVLLPRLPCRPFDFHKGQAGRVGVVAGSRGYVGAAIMTASGALSAGAGLITLYVREDSYPLFASQAPPEIMVRPVRDYREVLSVRHDVLAVGPGLGRSHDEEVRDLIRGNPSPIVLDADALNLLADEHLQSLNLMTAPALLTPHPGEMQRLLQDQQGFAGVTRRETVSRLASRFPRVSWLLKGSRTVIASANRPVAINTTGHPGMATGGMGDVLTGVCAALAGQGVPLHDAAGLGAWVCGRAAELALLHAESPESLRPTHVLHHLGPAFTDLRHLAW